MSWCSWESGAGAISVSTAVPSGGETATQRPGLQAGIEGETEPQLVEIEPQASLLIANENVHGVNPEVGVLPIGAVE